MSYIPELSIQPPGLLDIIKSRRSVRKFTSDPVPDHVINAAIEAGIWAPSACNQQPVRFVVLKRKSDIRIVNSCKLHIVNPQAAILVILDLGSQLYQRWFADLHTQQNPILDVGAAIQNMALVIHSYGLASCWVSFSPYLNYQGYRGFFRRFRFAETTRITSALLVGYPAQTIDIDRHKHHGRLIRRRPVQEHIMELPPRVLLLGAHPPDFDNLGSQAMTSGMMRLIEEEFSSSGRAVIEYPWRQPWPDFPTFQKLADLPKSERMKEFLSVVDHLVLLGRMLRDEREEASHTNWLGQIQRALPMMVGGLLKRSVRPIIPDYVAQLNDPLTMGRCPSSPEFPEGTFRRDDGWIVPQRTPQFPRLLTTQVGYWFAKSYPRLASYLLRRQCHGISLAYLPRLALMSWADIVFCDGDGVLADHWDWSRRLAIHILAEWLIAKRLGALTFVVNHSIAVKTPWLRELVAHVYNEMTGIVVREPKSKDELVEMGVHSDKVFVGADAAMWVAAEFSEYAENLWHSVEVDNGAIGLVVRGDMNEEEDTWVNLVLEMHQRYSRQLVFICSSKAEDLPFAQSIARRAPLRIIKGIERYEHMITILRHLSVVISSRYHPIYFSILAGTPFVPIRGNTFKTQALVSLIKYPLPTITNSIEFRSEIPRQLDYIYHNTDHIETLLGEQRERLRELAMLNVGVAEKMSE